MEYKTYGDRAVKLEKWPISSFGPSVSQSVRPSVTMISARDASASKNTLYYISDCTSSKSTAEAELKNEIITDTHLKGTLGVLILCINADIVAAQS